MKLFLRISIVLALVCFGVCALQAQVAGTLETGFNPIFDKGVVAVATQPDGKIIVGGDFTMVNGVARNRIARLNADGSLDTTFDPGTGTNDEVSYIAVQPDGKIIIAGAFFNVNGAGRNSIARLNADGSLESTSTFNIGSGPDSSVFSLALQPDGKILIGGLFANVNGVARRRLACLNADGSLGSGFSGPPNFVSCICVQPDARVLVGGLDGLSRLTSTGTFETTTTFANTIGGVVYALLVQPDGKILVGGTFNGPANSITRLNTDGTVDSTFNPGMGVNGSVYSIARQANGQILVAGDFSTVNGQPRARIARLNVNGSLESTATFNLGANNEAFVALQPDGKILLSGGFTTVNGQAQADLARLGNDAATQSLTTPDTTQVKWMRGGATADINQVVFEVSTTGGTTWTPLGAGVSITGGWQLTGLTLPASGLVRARSQTSGGVHEGSFGLIQQVAAIDYATEQPTLTTPATGAAAGNPFAIAYTLPESALAGSVKVTFDDSSVLRVLTLAAAGESTGPHAISFNPANPTASSAIASGPAILDGIYQVTLSYQDALAHPKASSVVATNVKVDTAPPSLSLPAPVLREAQNAAGARVGFTIVANDNLDPNPSRSSTPPSGSIFPIGTTTVNVTATDWAGNQQTGSFTVTVHDTTPPDVQGNFSPLVLSTGLTGTVPLPNYVPQATATDLVGVVSVTQTPPAGSARPAGITNVTVSAMDAAGNTNTAVFNVQVNDATNPEIGAPPAGFAQLTIPAGANGTASLPDYTLQAVTSDNVGVTSITQTPLAGTPFPPGVVPVTLTAYDAAGNTNSVSFNVTVVDLIPPSIQAPGGGFVPAFIVTGPDATVALPDYTAQAVTGDNVGVQSVTQIPVPGSPCLAGTTQVTLTAHDIAGNTTDLVFDVLVKDGTPPKIAAPAIGFAPLEITAGPDGTAALPDYTVQAVTSDNVGVTSVTQVPPPGDSRLFGATVVTLTAHDAAGNTQAISFEIVVRLDAPVVQALASIGGGIPGAGVDPRIPADATFARIGIPTVADNRALAFHGKWKTATGVETGIFVGDPVALLVASGDDAPGVTGAKFTTLNDPLIAPDGSVAFRATMRGPGITTTNDQGVWMSSDSGLTLVLREGTQIVGAPPKFKLQSISGLSLRNGELLVSAQLVPIGNLVTTANDSVLLQVTPLGATVLAREGDLLDLADGFPPAAIQSITALISGAGSPGQGRWQGDGAAIAELTLANQRRVILGFAADGSVTRSLAVGDGVPNLPATAIWSALNIPAIEPGGQGSVVSGTLIALVIPGLPPVVTPQNNFILAFSPNTDTPYSMFAREGSPAPGARSAVFATFLDPLVNDAGRVAFSATLADPGITATNSTGIWWGEPDALGLLARLNAPVPGPDAQPTAAKWSRFISLALPNGPNAGPVFTARIQGTGVTLKNNLGIWAVDSDGQLRQLLRTGDMVDGQAIIGIQTLNDVPAALGASRGFNARGTVAARVLLARGGEAVVRIDIPEGKTRITTDTISQK